MIAERHPRYWSIATRLWISALLVVLLVLPAAGALLAWNVRTTLHNSLDERLGTLLNQVIAGLAYQPATDTLGMLRSLGDPRFERVYSGWYWQAQDGAQLRLTSRSLWDQRLQLAPATAAGFSNLSGPREQHLRVLVRPVQLANLPRPLQVAVAVDLDSVQGEVRQFQALLAGSLTLLALLLLALLAWQLRWGLAPLRRLRNNLQRVESGQTDAVDTDLPVELAHLAGTINQVLRRDRQLIDRGRSAAGNLAHALKTPLSVLHTLVQQLPREQQGAFREEVQRIDAAIRHHLARASAAGPAGLGKRTDLGAALDPVLTALGTLAGRRGLRFEHELHNLGKTDLEEQDIQEMVGNLLENALLWAASRVRLQVSQRTGELTITVDDDGPGMSPEQCRQALDRGVRLDETRAGSGLGLAIVRELVELYRGELTLERSLLGGLSARISLPVG